MSEQIYEIIIMYAPVAANVIAFITSAVAAFCSIKKYVKKRINEVSPTEQNKKIEEELKDIKREILEMRGKRK